MIFVTGDCHGEYSKFNKSRFKEQNEMTKNDYVIVCGDFGFWDESDEQKWWREWLNDKPFTTLFIDGNHENYDLLNKYPVVTWNGGKVHKIGDSIIHLMRGQVFDINGLKFFTFGGARSHDIWDGIIEMDKAGKWKKIANEWAYDGKMFRINHLSWWKEEMPTIEEYTEGLKNLEKHDFKVDYILSHCGPSSTIALYSHGKYKSDTCTEFLEDYKNKTEYKRWYFGHYHADYAITSKDILLYDRVERID